MPTNRQAKRKEKRKIEKQTKRLESVGEKSSGVLIKVTDEEERKYSHDFERGLRPFLDVEYEYMELPDGKTLKREKAYRNEDMFVGGGPYDQFVQEHNPNGPRSPDDPKGYWADYYIQDRVACDPVNKHVRIKGYWIYSTSRGWLADGLSTSPMFSATAIDGTRGPNFRKMYYCCGFYSMEMCYMMGIDPSEFAFHLSA